MKDNKTINELKAQLEKFRPENVITPEGLQKVAERDRKTLERIIREEEKAKKQG